MKTVKTTKGTELPLIKLKGKDYLQVAHRLIWFNEEVKNFEIKTEFILIDDTQTVCKSTITIFDDNCKVVKSATSTKRETKSDFSDHTEKAETGSIGRALALLGFGTNFALADLDEGERIVDSPVQSLKQEFKFKYISTSFKDKDLAKAAGFKYNGDKKQWEKYTTEQTKFDFDVQEIGLD